MKKLLLLSLIALACIQAACMNLTKHKAAVQDDSSDRITVGTVQREIRVGMSSADVVQVLGAPNMVTTDSKRRETWVYDKVATDQVYSNSGGGFSLILLGVSGNSGASSKTQRTLTIIIKFDENGNVRDYSYRQSSF